MVGIDKTSIALYSVWQQIVLYSCNYCSLHFYCDQTLIVIVYCGGKAVVGAVFERLYGVKEKGISSIGKTGLV